MKQEFKKGDRVLVRNSDLQEWMPAIFEEVEAYHFVYHFNVIHNNGHQALYSQCRHIDDFRNGDEVQVRNSENYEWRNAIYAVYVPNAPFQHWVFPEDMDSFSLDSYALCRWHPSMPWAEKEEPLTLEQRVEALERKLNDQ
jgi:hypothetical protein